MQDNNDKVLQGEEQHELRKKLVEYETVRRVEYETAQRWE